MREPNSSRLGGGGGCGGSFGSLFVLAQPSGNLPSLYYQTKRFLWLSSLSNMPTSRAALLGRISAVEHRVCFQLVRGDARLLSWLLALLIHQGDLTIKPPRVKALSCWPLFCALSRSTETDNDAVPRLERHGSRSSILPSPIRLTISFFSMCVCVFVCVCAVTPCSNARQGGVGVRKMCVLEGWSGLVGLFHLLRHIDFQRPR